MPRLTLQALLTSALEHRALNMNHVCFPAPRQARDKLPAVAGRRGPQASADRSVQPPEAPAFAGEQGMIQI